MSPRAACRLEALGFGEVYDYVNGKSEWLAYGLATAGAGTGEATVAGLVRDDVATCGPDERIGSVRERVGESQYGFALVVADGGVLLGRLRRAVLDGNPDVPAQAVMEAGPSTVRPDTPTRKLAARLRDGNLMTALVTTPDGRLAGVVRAQDLA
ncbi:MAG: hypothetical protein NVS2B6_04690 [Thermoleophilaceae bacterium]